MMFPRVRDLAADRIPVAVTYRVLGFTKQAYFKWLANPVSQRDWDDAHLINAALDIHHDDPEFGYRFIADELADLGFRPAGTGSTGCARCSGSSAPTRSGGAGVTSQGRRSMTTWSFATSPPANDPTKSGSSTSQNTRHEKASFTSARSRTPAPTESWATRWPTA